MQAVIKQSHFLQQVLGIFVGGKYCLMSMLWAASL